VSSPCLKNRSPSLCSRVQGLKHELVERLRRHDEGGATPEIDPHSEATPEPGGDGQGGELASGGGDDDVNIYDDVAMEPAAHEGNGEPADAQGIGGSAKEGGAHEAGAGADVAEVRGVGGGVGVERGGGEGLVLMFLCCLASTPTWTPGCCPGYGRQVCLQLAEARTCPQKLQHVLPSPRVDPEIC
jgi:hypothetical protein